MTSKKTGRRSAAFIGSLTGGALLLLAASGASAAPLQQQVLVGSFSCSSGWCKGMFPVIPAGKRFDVRNASCVFTTTGTFIDAQLEYLTSNNTKIYVGLAQEWERANGSNRNGTFGKQVYFTVPAGKRATAVVQITGTLIGAHCQIFGDLL